VRRVDHIGERVLLAVKHKSKKKPGARPEELSIQHHGNEVGVAEGGRGKAGEPERGISNSDINSDSCGRRRKRRERRVGVGEKTDEEKGGETATKREHYNQGSSAVKVSRG
jgi:hypothetical protein